MSRSFGCARVAFVYGHICQDQAARDFCLRGHDLRICGEYVMANGKRECRSFLDASKARFYQREVEQARAAGLGIKAWRKRRTAAKVQNSAG